MEQGGEAHYFAEETFTTDYKMMMTLGQGQFSEVKLAFHIPTVSCVAVKILRNQKKYASLINSEINIMKSLAHPNIIKLFHVVQTRETTYLVMEHASEGDLLHHILELGSLEESEVQRLFTQIVHALKYCHDKFIIHRDIKANNILLDHRGNAKLCDFGLSTKVIPGQRLSGFCGTLNYCAPELFGKETYDGHTTDIWSLGVLLFFMVTGCLPFNDYSSVRVIQQILTADFRVPLHVSIDIRDVILKLLIINPYRRLTTGQIMRHPMVRNSEAHSPPTSTQSLPGTLSPSIVKAMTVMGYKSKEIVESLRDQKYNQVVDTYLILQHQSPKGDCYHHQEKPVRAMQPGLDLNLADLHTFPVSLGRATEPAPPTFTLPSKTKEKDEKKARPHQSDTTGDTDNMSSCSPQEELWISQEASQYFTSTGSSPWDTLQEETMTQDEAITHEATLTQDEVITHEATKTQEKTMTHEGTMT
ncbi:sperm motility kinase X-like [Peromyscus eremicus]|uniref:sperm motility kinase X-like n=1 Tax=Peromyscus eremicus TaxID=42410 RepID=UPI0027DB041C|nr:sperm motility kinase X-like [Peromyscus eremicus]